MRFSKFITSNILLIFSEPETIGKLFSLISTFNIFPLSPKIILLFSFSIIYNWFCWNKINNILFGKIFFYK